MNKEVLFELYSKMYYLREFEKLISKSFLLENIQKLPTSYYKLEALAVSLISVSSPSDYLFSTDRVHPYFILKHNKIERGIKEYFKILKNSENIANNTLRAFSFNDHPERVFNTMQGMALSFKETSFMPAFLITLDSMHATLKQFLDSVIFSITNTLPAVYIIERTKQDDITVLNNILETNRDKVLRAEIKTDDIFELRSVFLKAIRSAKEYLTPAVILCNAFNSSDPIEFLENKMVLLELSLDELKETLNTEINYLINEDLKEFLNVA
ncbi:MAG: hypothetical protein ACOX3T_05625 [Bdellovibrionota bacterium]